MIFSDRIFKRLRIIIGGHIVSVTSFHFTKALLVKSTKDGSDDIYFAGGNSLIAPKWTLTVAHCVNEF